MTAQTILPANSVVDTGFATNSLRFNRGSTDYLNRTLGTPTNVDKATFSTWVKFSDVTSSNDTAIFAATADGNNTTHLEKLGSQVFRLNMREGSNYIGVLTTNRVFRDPSAWYHIVVAFDTNQGTEANRVKLYINGVQETSFSTATYPTQNVDLRFNTSGQVFNIGNRGDTGNHPDAYYAETVFIDGQQLAADQFGEFDSDSPSVWKPIDVSGLTFGDNGFYLQFKGSGTSANSSGMGADTSGNDNHLTVNNLTAIDQSLDTCTNNHCTQNPIDTDANVVLSEGNLKVSNANNSYYSSCGTLAPVKGRWYFEAKVVSLGVFNVGITKATQDGTVHAQVDAGRVAYSSNGNLYDDSGDPLSDTSTTFGANDIIGVFLDLESGTQAVHFQKNGADVVSRNLADSYSGYTGGFKAAFGMGENDTTSGLINFGAPPFAISSSNSDANGYGDFEYSPVRSSLNYYTLNTKNLAEFG